MYRGGGGSKAVPAGFVLEGDRKRINEALDKHLERSSPSTSVTTTTTATGRALNGKDHHRSSSMFKTNSDNHHFKDAKASDGLSLLSAIMCFCYWLNLWFLVSMCVHCVRNFGFFFILCEFRASEE